MTKAELCAQLRREFIAFKRVEVEFNDGFSIYLEKKDYYDALILKSISTRIKGVLENFYVDRELLHRYYKLEEEVRWQKREGATASRSIEIFDKVKTAIRNQRLKKEYYFKRVKLDD